MRLRGAEDKEYGLVCACAAEDKEKESACALRKKRRNWHARSAEGKEQELDVCAPRTKSGIGMRLRGSPFLKTRSKDRGQR